MREFDGNSFTKRLQDAKRGNQEHRPLPAFSCRIASVTDCLLVCRQSNLLFLRDKGAATACGTRPNTSLLSRELRHGRSRSASASATRAG
jgi:hypothetical protein